MAIDYNGSRIGNINSVAHAGSISLLLYGNNGIVLSAPFISVESGGSYIDGVTKTITYLKSTSGTTGTITVTKGIITSIT